MKPGRLKLDLFSGALVLVTLGVALLVGALIFVAHAADEQARNQEQAVVANGLNVRISEMAETAMDYAHDNQARPSISAALTVSRDDELAAAAGLAETIDFAGEMQSAAAPLVDTIRRLNDLRVDGLIDAHIQASAIAELAGQNYVLTATPTSPTSGDIAVVAQGMDENFLSTLADRFLLDNLRVESVWQEADASLARVSLYDPFGNEAAALAWQPHTPGEQLLASALPPVFVLALVLAGVGLALHRRGRQAAESLKASEARATHLAYHDALTGLPNRLLLSERLTDAVEVLRKTNTPFAIHCVDLDRFKEVNDTYGHAAGDELIRLAAERIVRSCRINNSSRDNDIVVRLGGDEFAIVQVGATRAEASVVAQRIIRELREPFELVAGRAHIGASVGVAFISEPVDDAQEGMRQADLALYRVKEGGRGAYAFFEPGMDAEMKLRRTMQHDLYRALDQDELSLAYQPQVDGAGRLVGLEALLRWKHPERGDISPAEFIPIAEECALIDRLGSFSIRRAFEESFRWPNLRIAINVSAAQLRSKDFLAELDALVSETGVDPRNFELEITESVLLGDDPKTHHTLSEIRSRGFSLALDDFGTGYSSLSYLKRYPVTKVKIDRSFVSNLGVEQEADALIAAIVRLAHALRLGVIAEGVETPEQRLRLARAGCQEVQGYLIARPSSPETIDALFKLGANEAASQAASQAAPIGQARGSAIRS